LLAGTRRLYHLVNSAVATPEKFSAEEARNIINCFCFLVTVQAPVVSRITV
jgi:hypothetical protein